MERSQTAHRVNPGGSRPLWRSRAGLALAMLAALVILWQPNAAIGWIAVALLATGTVLAWPAPGAAGIWWLIVLAGVVLSLLAPLVALPVEAVGGWMAAFGVVLILSGGVAGFPATDRAGRGP